jgi:hypothetical protein
VYHCFYKAAGELRLIGLAPVTWEEGNCLCLL